MPKAEPARGVYTARLCAKKLFMQSSNKQSQENRRHFQTAAAAAIIYNFNVFSLLIAVKLVI